MQWLITGGCGFLGKNLIRNLLADENNAVRVIDNLSVGTKEDLRVICKFEEIEISDLQYLNRNNSNYVELITGNILDEKLALEVCQNIDVIVHLAANSGVAQSINNPRLDCLTNVVGTLNYLEAARHNGIKRFVFASSGGTVIGNCNPPIHEEMVPHPVAPYGASKLASEGYCSAYFRTFGVETVVLRFSNVYGPGSNHKNSVVAKFIRRALKGEVLEIYGDGTQSRDFIYIDDLIRAITLAARIDNIGGEIFQIANSSETTVNELVSQLLPVLAEFGLEKVQAENSTPCVGEVKRNFADTSKAKNLMGWKAETRLKEGLRQTVNWFINSRQLS